MKNKKQKEKKDILKKISAILEANETFEVQAILKEMKLKSSLYALEVFKEVLTQQGNLNQLHPLELFDIGLSQRELAYLIQNMPGETALQLLQFKELIDVFLLAHQALIKKLIDNFIKTEKNLAPWYRELYADYKASSNSASVIHQESGAPKVYGPITNVDGIGITLFPAIKKSFDACKPKNKESKNACCCSLM